MKDNLLDTIPTWGIEYKVSLEIYINTFTGERWSEIIRFGTASSSRPDIGYRIPAILTDSGSGLNNKTIIITTHMNDQWSWGYNKPIAVNEKTWHKVNIKQYVQKNEVCPFKLYCKV